MKLVVTGALGHIGSRLIRELPSFYPGCEIVMVDDMLCQRYCSLFDLPSNGRYRFIEADVCTADLDSIFQGADGVIHLAAITNAVASFDQKDAVERVNFEATKKVAEACLRSGSWLFYVSTTSVYGTAEKKVDESCGDDELKPQSPYAESKLKGERLLTQLGVPHVSCRFGTIFGVSPGMRFHTAVNRFCWQAVMGQPLSVWKTALHQMRPYLSLDDAIAAFKFFIDRGLKDRKLFDGRVYNVLTSNYTVSDIVEAIRADVPGLAVELVDSRIMNQLSYEVSDERLRGLGFRPVGDLKRGISETIARLKNAHGAG